MKALTDMTFIKPSTGDRKYWLVAAAVAGLVFSLPLIFLLVAHGNHLPFSCENLAFRFFGSARILAGQGGTVWPPQGHLLTLIQDIILGVLQMFTGDFQTQLQWFGIGTSVVVGLLMLGIYIVTCCDPRLLWTDKALILILGPTTVLGTVNAGFYYSLLPEYFALDLLIISASALLTLRYFRAPGPYASRDALLSGILAGVALANKVTMLGPVGMVVLVAITRRPVTTRAFLSRVCVAGLACLGAFACVLLAAYRFNPVNAYIGFRHAFGFLVSLGAESGFWEGNFRVFLHGYGYDKIILIWCAATLYLAIEIIRLKAWRAGVVLLANLLIAALLGIGLLKRGSGTTFFELTSILAGLASLMFAVGLGLAVRPKWVGLLPLAILFGAVSQFDYKHNWMVVTKSGTLSRTAWEVRNYALAFRQPVIVVFPNQSYYSGGSVEELLQTAFFSSLFGPADASLSQRYLSNTEFRAEPGPIEVGTTVVWFEKWDLAANQPLTAIDAEEARRWQSLTKIAAVNDTRTWRMGYSDQIIAHVCSVVRLE